MSAHSNQDPRQAHATRRAPAVTGQQVLEHAQATPPASDLDGEWVVFNALRMAVNHARSCQCKPHTGHREREALKAELDAALSYAVEKQVKA